MFLNVRKYATGRERARIQRRHPRARPGWSVSHRVWTGSPGEKCQAMLSGRCDPLKAPGSVALILARRSLEKRTLRRGVLALFFGLSRTLSESSSISEVSVLLDWLRSLPSLFNSCTVNA